MDRSGATDLVVALSSRPANRLRPQLTDLSKAPADVRVHWVDDVLAQTGEDEFRADPLWTVGRPPWRSRVGHAAKRLMDVFGALVGLMLLAPLFLVVAGLILATTGRPIFYTQERVGLGGRLFRIIKFRSMRLDAETRTGPIWAEFHDERCTRIGDWLRKTKHRRASAAFQRRGRGHEPRGAAPRAADLRREVFALRFPTTSSATPSRWG